MRDKISLFHINIFAIDIQYIYIYIAKNMHGTRDETVFAIVFQSTLGK